MDERISTVQRAIAQYLVEAKTITQQQAVNMPVADELSHIIPDLLRVCKDDNALALAVANHLKRPLFADLEEGVDVVLSPENENWVIYGSGLFVTNPYDLKQREAATAYARSHSIQTSSVGVISLSKLEALRLSSNDSDADGGDKNQTVHASQRINDLIREAAKLDASDIHLQPTQGDEIAVRMRIDGELTTKRKYKLSLHEAMGRVIMEMCSLVVDTNTAQDGKFDFELSAHKKLDIRVSTMPVTRSSSKALKFVLRLLGNNTSLGDLDKLGLSSANLVKLRAMGSAPNGLIVLTGPTGSGKTTTLNASLLDIYGRWPNRNYHTLEDPVEIQHEGIGHTEVTKQLTFANGLRALLRQDPDVILVGEMRDEETADLAFKAAMTGHLLLTTLHTNNAHASIERLARMNIPNDLIAGNATAFIAQRLVRALCSHCKVEYLFKSDPGRFAMYGRDRVFKGDQELRLFRAHPIGCKECNPDGRSPGGMKGRRSIIEILEMEPYVQEAILNGVSPGVLRRSQIANGTFDDLWSDGLRLVKEGSIGFEQLENVLKPYIVERPSQQLYETAASTNLSHKQPLQPTL